MIPKNIFFIWLTYDNNQVLPDLFNKFIQTWKTIYHDWNIRVITNDDLPEFDILGKFCSDCLKNKSRHPAFLSDILRAEVIHKYGGLYLDTDIECYKRMPDYIFNDHSLVVCEEPVEGNYICSGIYAEAQYGVFSAQIIKFFLENEYLLKGGSVQVWNDIFKNIKSLGELDYTIIPSQWFFPFYSIYIPEEIDFEREDLYGIHWYSATWADEDHVYRTSFLENIKRFKIEQKN
jgi:hypothetical protein